MTLVGLSEGDLASLIFSQIDDVQTWCRFARVSKRVYQISKQNIIEHEEDIFHIIKIKIKLLNGKLLELHKLYDHTGRLTFRHSYLNGSFHGLSQGWYANGQIRYIENYKNGNFHGLSKRWYSAGQIELERNWVNNELHGLSQGWYDNGLLKYENNWVNGVRRGCKQFDHY